MDHEVVVIGGGQAGLVAGHHLALAGADFVILDAEKRTGDRWRRRWDSLRLITPAEHSALPDAAWLPEAGRFPGKDAVADYLHTYATRWALSVRTDTHALRVERTNGGFIIETERETLHARAVIVATGATSVPFIPELSSSLRPTIAQLHSDDYRNPDQVPGERILVVGYGTSGAEIARELALAGRTVLLAGRHTPAIPAGFLAVAGSLWWVVLTRVLSLSTPIGRRVAPRAARHGAPLIGISPKQVQAAGVHVVSRVDGAVDGLPVSEGRSLDVDTIVWATGYRGKFSWLDLPDLAMDDQGYPVAPFGLATTVPGLGFVGMPFQSRLASPLLGAVGIDAAHVVTELVAELQLQPNRT